MYTNNILFAIGCSLLVASCYAVPPVYYPTAAVPAYSYAIQPSAPVLKAAYAQGKAEDFEIIDVNPSYSFKYGVSDPNTGDQKSQEESLKDGVVHGAYSLSEPDGTIRTVTYTADKSNGFNAIVDKHSPKAAHAIPAVAHAIQPITHAVPALAQSFQPVAQAVPVYHSAPAVPVYHPAPAVPVYQSAPVVPVYHSAPAAYKAPLSAVSYPYATYH